MLAHFGIEKEATFQHRSCVLSVANQGTGLEIICAGQQKRSELNRAKAKMG
jgi:hypothetical protein